MVSAPALVFSLFYSLCLQSGGCDGDTKSARKLVSPGRHKMRQVSIVSAHSARVAKGNEGVDTRGSPVGGARRPVIKADDDVAKKLFCKKRRSTMSVQRTGNTASLKLQLAI
jgi:hypothetical protein